MIKIKLFYYLIVKNAKKHFLGFIFVTKLIFLKP
ncbi:hypothetical protein N411_05335 [Helicobacter pylori FD535]|nr:hypothetical protein N411_05335 [Helicobacter pylori FD535]